MSNAIDAIIDAMKATIAESFDGGAVVPCSPDEHIETGRHIGRQEVAEAVLVLLNEHGLLRDDSDDEEFLPAFAVGSRAVLRKKLGLPADDKNVDFWLVYQLP